MADTNLEFLATLEAIIADRFANPNGDSYTAKLAAAGVKRVAQKVGEEAVELALAAAGDDRDEVVSETADLMYHLLVLLRCRDIGLDEIVRALEARHAG